MCDKKCLEEIKVLESDFFSKSEEYDDKYNIYKELINDGKKSIAENTLKPKIIELNTELNNILKKLKENLRKKEKNSDISINKEILKINNNRNILETKIEQILSSNEKNIFRKTILYLLVLLNIVLITSIIVILIMK